MASTEAPGARPGSGADRTADAAQAAASLAEWLEHERAVRARIAAPGVSTPAQLAALDGLDFLERMRDGGLPVPPIGATLDFVPVEFDKGRAVFQGAPAFAHYNPIGTVHGGWIATLLDSAVGCAVHSALPRGTGYTTLELKVNYVKAVTDTVPRVRAEGKVVSLSRRIGVAEGRLFDAAGRLYALATTTCLVFPMPVSDGATVS